MLKKITSIGVVGLVLVLATAFSAALPAYANHNANHNPGSSGNNTEHKIRICHATNSVTNPYESPEVDYDAVDGNGANDHSHHTGPVPASAAAAQKIKDDGIGKDGHWGDIIPPVEGVTAGLNWTTLGQAIWNNNCQYPKVANASVTTIDPRCEAGEKLVYGAPTNAVYSGTANGTTGPGSYNVTATATAGSLFAGGLASISFSGELDGPLTGEQCDGEEEPGVASAKVTVIPATCELPAQLVYGDLENASFFAGTPDGATGPLSYSVTAVADPDNLFAPGAGVSGDRVTKTFEGELSGILTGEECVLGENTDPDPTDPTPTTEPTPELLPETGAGTPLLVIAIVAGLAGLTAITTYAIRSRLGREL